MVCSCVSLLSFELLVLVWTLKVFVGDLHLLLLAAFVVYATVHLLSFKFT